MNKHSISSLLTFVKHCSTVAANTLGLITERIVEDIFRKNMEKDLTKALDNA